MSAQEKSPNEHEARRDAEAALELQPVNLKDIQRELRELKAQVRYLEHRERRGRPVWGFW